MPLSILIRADSCRSRRSFPTLTLQSLFFWASKTTRITRNRQGFLSLPNPRKRAEYGFGEYGFKQRTQWVFRGSLSSGERTQWVPPSLCFMCQSELTEFLAELTEFASELSEFSPPKQYSRNSIPPVSSTLKILGKRRENTHQKQRNHRTKKRGKRKKQGLEGQVVTGVVGTGTTVVSYMIPGRHVLWGHIISNVTATESCCQKNWFVSQRQVCGNVRRESSLITDTDWLPSNFIGDKMITYLIFIPDELF